MEPVKKADALCQRCGRVIRDSELKQGADKFCLQCAIEMAESRIPETKKEEAPKPQAKSKARQILQIMVLVIFAGLTVVNTVIIVKMLLANRPIEAAKPEYSKEVELCRENIASIASGREIPDSLTCPASGQPYQVMVVSGDTLVLCPNPQTHGVKAIKASAKNPKAEVEK